MQLDAEALEKAFSAAFDLNSTSIWDMTEAAVRTYIAALKPQEPVAWLKEWCDDGVMFRRVDLTKDLEPWLERLRPRVTPLAPVLPSSNEVPAPPSLPTTEGGGE